MRWRYLAFVVLFVIALGPLEAAGEGISNRVAVALDEQTFITVKDTVRGETISLYRVKGDRIVLVDVAVNTGSRSHQGERRYLHHEEIENR